MRSLRPFLVLLCALVVSVFAGGVLTGCGSSSTASGGGTIETTGSSDQGPTQKPDDQRQGDQGTDPSDDTGLAERPDSEVYASGRVVYPDTTAVPKAYVKTEPYAGAVLADSSGRFVFTKPLSEKEYTFIAEKGEMKGKTTGVSVPGDRVPKTVWIVVGAGERSLDAMSIDSIRANPGGPGLKRTGN